jgi:predicted nucleic acid-binding protein
MKKLKLYLDTSVWNFIFADDAPEKQEATLEFFENVEKKYLFEIYISSVVLLEIEQASFSKKEKLLNLIKRYQPVILAIDEEIESLAGKYIEAKIIPSAKRDDALHIAVSVIAELDALISWNYRHLANLRVKELIQSVNLREGYLKTLELTTPLEVIASGRS